MSQSTRAKKIRREVRSAAGEMREKVIMEFVMSLYNMPLYKRIKWAYWILRGMQRDWNKIWSIWLWKLDAGIESFLMCIDGIIQKMKVKGDA